MLSGTVACDMQGWVSEMQSTRPRCMHVCISETQPCMLSKDLTILLFYSFSTVLFHYLLCYYLLLYFFLLFYHDPSRLHLGNPTLHVEPGFYILLFYYFRTVLLHDLRFYYLLLYYFTILPRPQPLASRKPNLACRARIILFCYSTVYYLLLYYFPILSRPQPFASRKPNLAC